METLISINSAINNFVWGIPAMVCILGIGLYLSIRTRFIQVRKFGLAMKETFGKIFVKG
jgi:AGCS family alanine or glycine:cation symporter